MAHDGAIQTSVGRVMTRPRHTNKHLESVLRLAEIQGWTVEHASSNYYRMRCPCGAHQQWMHRSPSNPTYERRFREQLKRTGCWTEATE